VSVAACLTAQALNIGYAPVAKKGTAALEPGRLAHVSRAYLSAEAFSKANAPLIDAQAGIPFARALGGGLVAAIDGMRFVVPVPSVYARPNRKYFGLKRGVTWLNMINDQAAGIAGKVVGGTVRDSLHMVDVWYSQDGGQRPDIIVSDTGSYSDLVFGLPCSAGSTGPRWPTSPTRRAGASARRPTTARSARSPAARSTWPGSARTGATSCAWSCRSTPARSAPTRWSACSGVTATPPP
jgi:hypothetical protein